MNTEKQHNTIEVDQLAIGYKHKKKNSVIANGISFKANQGELISIVGANGVGKSTLLRTLTGMQPKLDGSITIEGEQINTLSSHQLALQLSVVLTEAPASKNLTVLELIELGRQPHTNWMGALTPKDKARIEEAMQLTDTFELRDQKCYELSDGQLQRVTIARALAQDTPLIILDEPTTHLDLYHRAYVLKLLQKLTIEKNKTILFSTHEIDLAIQVSHRMLVMTDAQIVMDTPEALIKNGHFSRLFPKESIRFDTEKGRFTIEK